MLKTIELTLEKECDLQPGADLHLLKVDGKKLTLEVKAGLQLEIKKKTPGELEAMAKQQGVGPMSNVDAIREFWPFPDNADDLFNFVMESRKAQRASLAKCECEK